MAEQERTPSPRSRKRRRSLWLLVTVVSLGAVVGASGIVAERFIRHELDAAASRLCATVDPQAPPTVYVSLLQRTVRITGLAFVPLAECSGEEFVLRGHLDTLEVSGVSLLDLVFTNTISVDRLLARAHALQCITRAAKGISNTQKEAEAYTIEIGSFDIRLASAHSEREDDDTLSLEVRDIAITGNNLHFILGKEGSDTDLHCEQLKLLVDSFDLLSTTGYAAAFDHCMVDQEQGTLDLFCLSAGPTLGLEAHSATMRFEGDVYQARLDTVNARGLDVERLLAQRNCSARSVFVTSGDIAILRDKTLPDGPDPVKPLLARVVRGFSSGSGADTVVLRGVDITYQERGSRSRGFALIPFSAVNGTITGVRNNASDTAQLAINAECVAFGTAPVRLAFTTAINDTTDRFNVSAWIGALPFNALNTATVPLANIRATEGVMDSLIFEMHADDRNAHGTVRMTYAGLKLDSGWKRDSDLMQDVKTALLNTLVRDKNNERDGVAKPGKYTLARHRNRSVFNYLWSGLREGVKAVLLPQAVSGQEQ